jgi:hypothetical protein
VLVNCSVDDVVFANVRGESGPQPLDEFWLGFRVLKAVPDRQLINESRQQHQSFKDKCIEIDNNAPFIPVFPAATSGPKPSFPEAK